MPNTIYDVDFDKFATQMLPPDKRYNLMVRFVKKLVTPVRWMRDVFLGICRAGFPSNFYDIVTTYTKYDRVRFNNSVYESLGSNNTGNLPTDTAYWMLISENFIGVSERVNYNGVKLTLEYALNKWFNTTFRQPPLIPDIYIDTNDIPISTFIAGLTEPYSSSAGDTVSSEFIGNSSFTGTSNNFTIYVPVAVYNALDTGMVNNEKIFRNFADRYVPAGLIYNIVTY